MFVWGVSTSNIRRALAALTVLVLALGISACGGSDESDEEKVEKTLETALVSTDAEACGESRTIAYMEETTDLEGEKAEAECERVVSSRDQMPDSIAISKVEVSEDGTATALVAMKGGDPDGLVVKVALVEEDGSWKIDEFAELVRLDRERFTAKFEREFKEQGMDEEEIRCEVEAIDELSQSDFEQLALGEDETLVDQVIEGCAEQVGARAEEEELAEIEAEVEGEEAAELAEIEAEETDVEYPRAVKQNFLKSCLATSGSNFSVCECSLDTLEANYSVREIQQAEANIASGRMREMIETAFASCA